MFSFLSYPYPTSSLRSRATTLIIVSVFVTLFLAWFQPFGLAGIPSPRLLLVCLSYGAISAICIALVVFAAPPLFPQFFDELRWTAGREFIVTLANFLLVGLGNTLLSAWYGFFPLDMKTLLYFQLITLSVGIFPIAALIAVKYLMFNARHGRDAEEITQIIDSAEHHAATSEQVITFHSTTDSAVVTISAEQLLFVAAAQNYIEIRWHDTDSVRKELLRNTMRSAEAVCAGFPAILRCHRGYIVNIDNVISVKGNARGLVLSLRDCHDTVPVSRSFIPAVEHCFSSHAR